MILKLSVTMIKNLFQGYFNQVKGAKTSNPIGSGSTADAIRQEFWTGNSVGGKFHTQKAEQYINALNNWLRKNPTASATDRATAEMLKLDLSNALRGF